MLNQLSPPSEQPPLPPGEEPLPPQLEMDPDQGEDLALEEPETPFKTMEDGTQVAGPWGKIFKKSVEKFKVGKTTQAIKEAGERGRAPDIPRSELQDTADSFKPPDEPLEPRTQLRNLNVEYFDTPEDIHNAIDVMATKEEGFMEARRGVRSHAQTQAAAEAEVHKIIGAKPQDGWTAERMLGARNLLAAQATKLHQRATQLGDPAYSASDQDWAEFARAQANFVTTQRMVAGATAEIGRALNSFKIAAGQPGATRAVQMAELIEKNGGVKNLKQRAKLLAQANDDPAQLADVSRRTWNDVTGSVVREIWLAGILSGPQTHAVNVVSNTLVQAYEMALVKPMAAALSPIRQGVDAVMPTVKGAETDTQVYLGEVVPDAFGAIQGTIDGLSMFANSIKDPNWVPTGMSKAEIMDWKAVSSRTFNMDPKSTRGRAVDAIGDWYVRLPFRFLEAEDQLFKSIAYRREINALAFRKAKKEGWSGDEFAAKVSDYVRDPPEESHLAARAKAEHSTFTNPSDEAGGGFGKAAKALQVISGRSTLAKFIIPFVRTPYNLVAYAVENSALAPLSKRWRNDMAAGGARRDMAMSRMALGSMVVSAVSELHDRGVITGDGPTNKGMTPHLKALHWQANSIQVDGNYVSYNRADPFGIMIASVANGLDAIKYSDSDVDKTELAAHLILNTIKNLTGKTYMQGISELFSVIQGTYGVKQGAINMTTGAAASFVPSWLNTIARSQDPRQRASGYDVDSFSESFFTKAKGRTPWGRGDLPFKYDWKGEVIVSDTQGWEKGLVPFTRTTGRRDRVSEILLASQVPVKKPKPMIAFYKGANEVDVRGLDHQQGFVYAKLQELVGKARYSAIASYIPAQADVNKFTPNDEMSDKFRSILAKGTRLGKREFALWYAKESQNHSDWIQLGTDQMQELVTQSKPSGGDRMPPHVQQQSQPQSNTPGF